MSQTDAVRLAVPGEVTHDRRVACLIGVDRALREAQADAAEKSVVRPDGTGCMVWKTLESGDLTIFVRDLTNYVFGRAWDLDQLTAASAMHIDGEPDDASYDEITERAAATVRAAFDYLFSRCWLLLTPPEGREPTLVQGDKK